jgi:hypothetical protein
MKTWEKLKELCEKSDRFVELTDEQMKIYKKEIKIAKRFYDNGRNLYEELIEKQDALQTNYIIPYILRLTNSFTNEKQVYVQVKAGASGGIDVDTDWQGEGREKIYNYLKEKYGEERVLHVGTFSTLGPASAAKDVLRANGVDFGKSNKFTKVLEKMESWQENLDRIKATDRENWKFYNDNKDVLDNVPELIGKIRQSGKHAGGIVITEKPIYNYIPVDRVNGEAVTAFPESGSNTVLDEIGIIKYDVLGISILDVMAEAIDMIDEEMYEIEDDDGIIKIVPASYLDSKIKEY